ncbi:MAG TPA: DUF2630 family protein [Candidatus Limnocylindrales bacterium]|nr:DUF2630 family protein [Candidatus Limnocylindrales bacterium]
MDDKQILERITALVDEERELRARRQGGKAGSAEEATRLRELEGSLDQCWDLLRRRRAAREFGSDPNEVTSQSKPQVEGYLQ